MIAPLITINGMAKKAKPSGGKQNRSPGYVVYARIDPEIGAAFERYMATREPATTARLAVEYALKRVLTEAGLWPPPTTPAS